MCNSLANEMSAQAANPPKTPVSAGSARTVLRRTVGSLPGVGAQDVVVLETAIDSASLLFKRMVRRHAFRRAVDLDRDTVEAKYDRLGGTYNRTAFDDSERGVFLVDGAVQEVSRKEFNEARFALYVSILSKLNARRMLEVGAGELTTLGSLATRMPDKEAYGIDLSFARVFQGQRFFRERFGLSLMASKADAAALPFADKAFDLVFTSHCLEHMPLEFQKGVAEACRVSSRYVVFFEPSYELGNWAQKLRMRAQGYVRGLTDCVRAQTEFRLVEEPYLLSVGSLNNRTAVHIMERVNHSASEAELSFACPKCHSVLSQRTSALVCVSCSCLYPVVEGIPLLDQKWALAAGADSGSLVS